MLRDCSKEHDVEARTQYKWFAGAAPPPPCYECLASYCGQVLSRANRFYDTGSFVFVHPGFDGAAQFLETMRPRLSGNFPIRSSDRYTQVKLEAKLS